MVSANRRWVVFNNCYKKGDIPPVAIKNILASGPDLLVLMLKKDVYWTSNNRTGH